jgi:hypothetical protein
LPTLRGKSAVYSCHGAFFEMAVAAFLSIVFESELDASEQLFLQGLIRR